MAKRAQYTTTMDEEKLVRFRKKLESDRVKMNEVLDLLVDLYLDEKVIYKKDIQINL